MDEPEAILALKRGDIKGLEVLVRKYQTQALRTANMILRDPARAEDIVQEVYLRVYKRILSFDATRPFGPWLMRIVANEALRSITPQREISLQSPLGDEDLTLGDVLPDEAALPPEIFETQEMQQQLWDALGALSPLDRSLITLRYFLELSEAEIADHLDCPLGTAKWRLHEARKRLRQQLEARLSPEFQNGKKG